MSPKLYGFSLGDKCWGVFALAGVSKVVFNAKLIDSLRLNQDRKDLVRDLVVAHQAKNNPFDDVVRSKGKGLVGLLSGPAGIGKTMTAEVIAEVAGRPLYVVSSGELGDTPEKIHWKLKKLLELAEVWRAVVLLDEADVFLGTRSEGDLAKNAIASVFLRELEYYQGILILTTNRLKSIDTAFQSRIHFYLEYPRLDASSRESIWKDYLGRAAKIPDLELDPNSIDYSQLGGLTLNGRQIKNIMSVAQSISVERKESITVKSIKSIIDLCQRLEIGDEQGSEVLQSSISEQVQLLEL